MIPIVHNSGGPKDDILRQCSFKKSLLCTSIENFADSIARFIMMDPLKIETMSKEVHQQSLKFSSKAFVDQLVTSLHLHGKYY